MRYRILKRSGGYYTETHFVIQQYRWWWPFWTYVMAPSFPDPVELGFLKEEEAKDWIDREIAAQTTKKHEVIEYPIVKQ